MAFHVTQCPGCDSTFNTNARLLDSAGGKVRCGACLTVFEAEENFIGLPDKHDSDFIDSSVFVGNNPLDYFNPSTFLTRASLTTDENQGEESNRVSEPAPDTSLEDLYFSTEPLIEPEVAAEQEPSVVPVVEKSIATKAHRVKNLSESLSTQLGDNPLDVPQFAPPLHTESEPDETAIDATTIVATPNADPVFFDDFVLEPDLPEPELAELEGEATEHELPSDDEDAALEFYSFLEQSATDEEAPALVTESADSVTVPGDRPEDLTLSLTFSQQTGLPNDETDQRTDATPQTAEPKQQPDSAIEESTATEAIRVAGGVAETREVEETGRASDTGGVAETGRASDTGGVAETGRASDTGEVEETGRASDTGGVAETGRASDTGTVAATQTITAAKAVTAAQTVAAAGTVTAARTATEAQANTGQERLKLDRKPTVLASTESQAEVEPPYNSASQQAQASAKTAETAEVDFDSSAAIRARALQNDLEDEEALETLPQEKLAALRDVEQGLELIAKKESHWVRRVLYTLLALFLMSTLTAQYFWKNSLLYSQSPRLRPFYEWVCASSGCELPTYSDIQAIRSDKLEVRSHPQLENSLMINITFRNTAEFPQAFPILVLSFNTAFNDIVALREFSPAQYLDPELQSISLMPVMQPVQINLELIDPGPDAVNYTMAFRNP